MLSTIFLVTQFAESWPNFLQYGVLYSCIISCKAMLWQSKRDKIIKIQTQGYKSTELHMEWCKRSNLQTQGCKSTVVKFTLL